ncbi:hypothetical protein ACRRTK_023709 [Alexandromys fortis]
MGLLAGDGLWSVAIFIAIFLLLVDLMHRRQRRTACYPPGPVTVPVLGNLLQLDFQNIQYSMYKLCQRYGDVFSLQMAWKPVVVINGLKAVREVLVTYGEDTADRPSIPVFEYLGFKPRSQGCPFNPSTFLNKSVCNVIASLIFARRFEYEDPDFTRMLKLIGESLKEVSGIIPEVLNSFPMLLRIPGLGNKVFEGQRNFMVMMDNLLTENRRTRDPEKPPRNLSDAFLAEIEKAKGNPESSFNDENLRMVVGDLFGAGMVTTSTTLSWALLLMILHPDVQSRVQQEIDEVIGQVRRPEMADQARMPYTNAVVHEVQRFGDISPLTLPRITSRDIKVQGFLIPKDLPECTYIAALRVLRNEDCPMGTTKGAFGKHCTQGRRACLGEPLARMELFLFFTCLLQRFSFSLPSGQPRPSDYGNFPVPVAPFPYQLCAVMRQQGH